MRPSPQQTADEVPPEALATPPTFIPDRETPEAAEIREAEDLPGLPPLKYNHPAAKQMAERQHAEADKQRRSGERHADAERQRAEAERHKAEQARAAQRK